MALLHRRFPSFAALVLGLALVIQAAARWPANDGQEDRWAGIDTSIPAILLFHSVECPISDRYVPLIKRLHATYQGVAGIRFYLVFPNQNEKDAAVRSYLEKRRLDLPVLRDRDATLTLHLGARVTPEAVVALPGAPGPEVVYRGRYDDRYSALGRSRPQAVIHYLDDVLAALAKGERPAFVDTKAVGCYIVSDKLPGEGTLPPPPPPAHGQGAPEEHRH
jgi:hypothetical protein